MLENFNKTSIILDNFKCKIDHQFRVGWLTLNRVCNLRCPWCYARDTHYSQENTMDFETAKKIIDILVEANVRKVILIGGEPTLYPDIFKVLDYCYEKNLNTTIATNGVVFANKDILQQYKDHHVTKISMSIKAFNDHDYEQYTGLNSFSKVLEAVKNLVELDMNFALSTVISSYSIDNLLEGLIMLKNAGAPKINMSFCYNYDEDGSSIEEYKNSICGNPYILAHKYQSIYFNLKKAMGDCKFILSQTLPCCVWDPNFLALMIKDKTIAKPCQLVCGTGLLFDTQANLIPCNAMYPIKLGTLGKDFNDFNSLKAHLATEDVTKQYNILRGVSDPKCLQCNLRNFCGGGCSNFWTNFNMQDLENFKKEYEALKLTKK